MVSIIGTGTVMARGPAHNNELKPYEVRVRVMISTLNQTAEHPGYNYDLEEGGFTAIHKQHINDATILHYRYYSANYYNY